MNQDKFKLNFLQRNFLRFFRKDLPIKLAQHSLLFFRTNFQKGGYEDLTFTPWKPTKKVTGRKVLVKTGKLRDSIKVKSETFDKIEIGSDVPYGDYHNEGTPTMPQRKFLYESQKLDQQITKMIDDHLLKMFK